MSHALPIYLPTKQRPPKGRPCEGCSNAGPYDEFGGVACRLLDDPANIEDHELHLAGLVQMLWSGDAPDVCPGWQEPVAEVCEEHGPFLSVHGCGPCEAKSWAEPWEVLR